MRVGVEGGGASSDAAVFPAPSYQDPCHGEQMELVCNSFGGPPAPQPELNLAAIILLRPGFFGADPGGPAETTRLDHSGDLPQP